MNKNLIISAHSQVTPGSVRLNGEVIFRHEDTEPVAFLKAAYRGLQISYPKFFKMDKLCKLAILGAEILLADGRVKKRYLPVDFGIILQNASSSLTTDEKHQETITDRQNYFPSPSVFVYTLPNIMAGEIAIRHGLKGENAVQVLQRPDAEFLFDTIHELFYNRRVKVCLAGWVEEYRENLTCSLFLVENPEELKTSAENMESIIFDPLNIERLFKEVS